ncbi:MAG TPA: ribokinase [Gemmataceae bacterium]|nr:ribokinase [Gemmataceae bacterium]
MPVESGRRPHVIVVGSINMDFVVRAARLPRPGETLPGHDLRTYPGGKGANQAVAAARLGARVTMIGRVGDDRFGPKLLDGLEAEGVSTRHVRVTEGCTTGVAVITVEDGGQNAILIVAGANGRLTKDDLIDSVDVFSTASALLLQLEVPLETVVEATALGELHNLPVILDPAPAPSGPLPAVLSKVQVLTPNQAEAEALTGMPVTNLAEAERAARALRDQGARNVVLKMGASGALLCGADGRVEAVPTACVPVVDTTAAGDAFTAALAVGLCHNLDDRELLRFACAAGTLATTRAGAQPAMPTRAEVEQFLPRMPGRG